MATFKLAGIVSAVLAANLYADSIVNYTVELSPLNATYVSNYKSGSRTYFTVDGTYSGASLGNPANSQQFPLGSIITWDLKVAIDPAGLHNQPGHPSNGKPPAGLANLVFNLQLEDNNGNLIQIGAGSATTPGWYSAINDGTGGDPLAAAAAALSYNTVGLGPGRAIDAPDDQVAGTPNGGPNMNLFTYPKVVPGKLLGQGCGYTAWVRSGGNVTRTYAGIGLDTITRPTPPGGTATGLGIRPICEGQINTTGLPAGAYKLKVLAPAGSVNVLRGDLDLVGSSANSFAVPANVVNGDEITFQLSDVPGQLAVTITPPEAVLAGAQFAVNGGSWQNPGTINLVQGNYTVSFKPVNGYITPDSQDVAVSVGQVTQVSGDYLSPPPLLQLAVSNKQHGPAGSKVTWSLPLRLSGTATNEPRQGGPTEIVLAYDRDIAGTISVSGMAVTEMDQTSLATTVLANGANLTITLANVPDVSCVTLTIHGVGSTAGAVAADHVVRIGACQGDVNGTGSVTGADINAIRSLSTGDPITEATYRYDINLSGSVTGADINFARAFSTGDQIPICE